MTWALRPETLPTLAGLELARGERRVAYKDAHDAFSCAGGAWISLADSAGTGLQAARGAAQARACLRSLCREGGAPSEVLTRANRDLCELLAPEDFVACALLRWDLEREALTWSGAGLGDLWVYRAAEDRVERIRLGGVVLGIAPAPPAFLDHPLQLGPRDALLLASDGLVELSRPSGEFLGVEAVGAAFAERASAVTSAEGLVAELLEWVDEARGACELEDDITLLVLRRPRA